MALNLDFSVVHEIIKKHDYKQVDIIPMLQEIQEFYHYLPREVFTILSKELKMGEARIYSIATFYENFSLEPKGKYVIKVCDGTACHVRKSIPILNKLRSELGLSESKKTTDDLNFTVETVSCLGACGLAPVITVNDVVHPEMTPEKVVALLNELKEEIKNAEQ
jgi:NADH-quinone oxidoreductase subunit E